MNEALTIWKKIAANPITGFSHITANTRIWIPIVIVLILILLSTIPLIPVISSQAYHTAMMESVIKPGMTEQKKIGKELTNDDKLTRLQDEMIVELMGKPTLFSILMYSLIAINFQIMSTAQSVIYSALLLFFIGLFFRQRIFLRHYFTLFIFISIIFVIEATVKNCLVLFSDFTTMFKDSSALHEFSPAAAVQTSIAAFINRDSMGVLSYFTLDYFTDIFRLILFAYVFFAILGTWKTDTRSAVTAMIIFAMLGYLGTLLPQLLFPSPS